VLSAVVFLIGLKLVQIAGMREIARLRKDEFVVAALTALVVVVVGVEEGIILAILLSLILHVRRHYAPIDVVLTWDDRGHVRPARPAPGVRTKPGLTVYRFGAGIFYANAERLSEEVLTLAGGDDPPRWLVIDMASVDDVDFTGGKTLGELADQLEKRGVVLALAEVRDNVRDELERYGLLEKIGEDRTYESVQEAVADFDEKAGSPAR
jgi:MFS superfamily sulfate permease-like transporter